MVLTSPSRRFGALLVALALAVGLVAVTGTRPARAAGPNVMFLETMNPDFAANIVAGLNGTGQLGTVTDFNGEVNVPIASDFVGIDVVLVASDNPGWGDPDGIGDALADYVDGGGRVVQMVFGLYCPSDDLGVGGRWVSEGYGAFDVTPCEQIDGDGPLGFTAVDAASPLLAGVTSFNGGGSSYRNAVTLAGDATLVATWDDEASLPFEAWTTAHTGCVVGLNFFPPSSDARDDLLGRLDRRLDPPGQRTQLRLRGDSAAPRDAHGAHLHRCPGDSGARHHRTPLHGLSAPPSVRARPPRRGAVMPLTRAA